MSLRKIALQVHANVFTRHRKRFYATDACIFFRTQNWKIAVITKRWFNTECE